MRKSGEELKLTAKEFDLLWFLASHPRKVFSRDQLMSRVWGYEAALDTGTVTVHMRRLREKIEDEPSHPRFLQTVWGVGYRFVAMIGFALLVAAGTLAGGPRCCVRAPAAADRADAADGLALVAVVLPLAAVLLSGGRDVQLRPRPDDPRASRPASATAALVAALLVGRSIASALSRLARVSRRSRAAT